jgi:hypothetical protein
MAEGGVPSEISIPASSLSKPETPSASNVPPAKDISDSRWIDRLREQTDKLEQKNKTAEQNISADDVGAKENQGQNLTTKTKVEEPTTNKTAENTEAKTQSQEDFESAINDPLYQQILGEKVLKDKSEGKNTDLRILRHEALTEYAQQEMEKAEEQIEAHQGTPLTAEQKKVISKEFGNAFKADHEKMANVTKKAAKLAEAKAKEAKLKDQGASEEQMKEAARITSELQGQFDEALDKVNKYFDKKSYPTLEDNLKKSVEDAKMLALLQKEKKKSMLRMILEMALAIGYSIAGDVLKQVSPIPQS